MRERTPDYNRPPPLQPRSEEPQELSFDDDDTRDSRAGDLLEGDSVEQEYPRERERTAGLTGAALPDGDVSADDLSPETLLDEDAAHGEPSDELAADQMLRNVGPEEIGGGLGLDEEEQARRERPEISTAAPGQRDDERRE